MLPPLHENGGQTKSLVINGNNCCTDASTARTFTTCNCGNDRSIQKSKKKLLIALGCVKLESYLENRKQNNRGKDNCNHYMASSSISQLATEL